MRSKPAARHAAGVVLAALVALCVVLLFLVSQRMHRATPPAIEATPAGSSQQATPSPQAPTPSVAATASANTSTSASSTSSSSASSSASASSTAKKAIVLGDGYTASSSWVEALQDKSGWIVENWSERGMGYRTVPQKCDRSPCKNFGGLAERLSDAAPEAIILVGGAADPLGEIADAADAVLTTLKKALPEATLLVVPPLNGATGSAWATEATRALRTAATEHGATFVDAEEITGSTDSYSNDALTDEAGTKLADRVAASLT